MEHKPKVSCVYKIQNILNSFIYIGSTENYISRKKQHLYLLNKGKHHSCKLQEDFDVLGEDKFIFDLIEEVSLQELRNAEQKWIDFIKPEYNTTPVASLEAFCLKRGVIYESNTKTSYFVDYCWTQERYLILLQVLDMITNQNYSSNKIMRQFANSSYRKTVENIVTRLWWSEKYENQPAFIRNTSCAAL